MTTNPAASVSVPFELVTAAEQWATHDPANADALRHLLSSAATDSEAATELIDSFSGSLQFGTAGLRGAMAAGPNRMNQVVVRRAAAGVAAHLVDLAAKDDAGTYRPRAVVGFDARHHSAEFARDTAAIFAAAGIECFLLPSPLPTPVLAFAVRALAAEAGVMVTASHNPARDNGYKVYLGGRAVAPEARGVQIVAPHDSAIAAHIAAVSATEEAGDTANIPMADSGWTVLAPDFLEQYLAGAVSVLDPAAFPARELRIVHTSMHGVGHETATAALSRAGFADVHPVAEQAVPDPEFPTVAFPNPEEAGALDLAFALATETGADIVLANDPDADRLAVGVFDPATGGWHALHGDQVGALLGSHLTTRGGAVGHPAAGTGVEPPLGGKPVFANSIVSSRLLAKVAAAAGLEHRQTLTGFKWIARTPGLGFGYEEALGYAVAPEMVRDKDGISAAVLMAELAATLKAEGRTLLDALDDLALVHGLHVSGQLSLRVESLPELGALMLRLRTTPPTEFAGSAIIETVDLAQGSADLPPTDGLRYTAADGTRVIVRPSGTEPKLKCYTEVILPVASRDELTGAKEAAAARLADITAELRGMLS